MPAAAGNSTLSTRRDVEEAPEGCGRVGVGFVGTAEPWGAPGNTPNIAGSRSAGVPESASIFPVPSYTRTLA